MLPSASGLALGTQKFCSLDAGLVSFVVIYKRMSDMTIDFMSFGHQDTDSFSGFCCSISRSSTRVSFSITRILSIQATVETPLELARSAIRSQRQASQPHHMPYGCHLCHYGHLWTMDVTLALVFNWCSGVQLRSVQRWPQGQAFVSGQMLAI